MRVYITGGTGFIGSYVVRELAGGRDEIIVMARNPDKVPALKRLKGVRIVKAPMQDFGALARNLKRPDALVHIALCWGDTAVEMMRNETIPSVRLINLAAERGAKSVIFTSSTAAVGYEHKKILEDSFRLPEDFYGASKGSVELFINAFSRLYPATRFNVIRPGYTFGNPAVEGASTENDQRLIRLCGLARKGKTIEVNAGDGTQFIWAGHLARIYRAVLSGTVRREIFYGLSRNFLSWEEISRMAVELCGSKSRVVVRGRAGRPHLFCMDKTRKFFGLSFDSRPEMREHLKWLLAQTE